MIFVPFFQEPTFKIRAPTQVFVNFLHKCLIRFSHAFLLPTTFLKRVQNDIQAMKKSMLKTGRLSTSFFGVLECVWKPLGLPSWHQLVYFGLPGPFPKASKIRSFGKVWPTCSPRSSRVIPRKSPKYDFRRFLIHLGIFSSLFCNCENSLTSTSVFTEGGFQIEAPALIEKLSDVFGPGGMHAKIWNFRENLESPRIVQVHDCSNDDTNTPTMKTTTMTTTSTAHHDDNDDSNHGDTRCLDPRKDPVMDSGGRERVRLQTSDFGKIQSPKS